MALLTDDIQAKLTSLLIEEGLVVEADLQQAAKDAQASNKPLLAILSERGLVDEELVTHAIAYVSGVPYVNLLKSTISQDVLNLLQQDIAERFMAF